MLNIVVIIIIKVLKINFIRITSMISSSGLLWQHFIFDIFISFYASKDADAIFLFLIALYWFSSGFAARYLLIWLTELLPGAFAAGRGGVGLIRASHSFEIFSFRFHRLRIDIYSFYVIYALRFRYLLHASLPFLISFAIFRLFHEPT